MINNFSAGSGADRAIEFRRDAFADRMCRSVGKNEIARLWVEAKEASNTIQLATIVVAARQIDTGVIFDAPEGHCKTGIGDAATARLI